MNYSFMYLIWIATHVLVLNYKIFFVKDTNILFPVSIYASSVWAYIVHNFVNYFLKFPC